MDLCLLVYSQLALFSQIVVRTLCLRGGTTSNGLCHPLSIDRKDNLPQACPQAPLIYIEFIKIPGDSRLCQVDTS